MPYFYKEDTYEIVFNPHQYNSAAIDGHIISIGDDDQTILISHIPTKEFNWDVKVVNRFPAQQGYEKLKEIKGDTKKQKGKPFYKLILDGHLRDYISENDQYSLIEVETREEVSSSGTKLKSYDKKETSPELKPRSNKRKPSKERYSMRLMRHEEKPIKS